MNPSILILEHEKMISINTPDIYLTNVQKMIQENFCKILVLLSKTKSFYNNGYDLHGIHFLPIWLNNIWPTLANLAISEENYIWYFLQI